MKGVNTYIDSVRTKIQAEHRELASRLKQLTDLLNVPCADVPWNEVSATLEEQILELQKRLEHHFHQEEMEGYMDEAAANLPRLSAQVEAVKHEHAALLSMLREFLVKVHKATGSSAGQRKLCLEFKAFANQLREHERKENHILEAGYNEEFDVGL